MKAIKRRDFLRYSVCAGGLVLSSQIVGCRNAFAGRGKKFTLNVGYLPISDHLILPVSHALDNDAYRHVKVRPYLCKSWDEILGKVDMGILHAAFMLAPLAMHMMNGGSPLRCVLLGHTNGSVIAAKKSISDYKGLMGKTIGIPHSKSTHMVLLYKYLKSKGIGLEHIDNIKFLKIPPPLTVKNIKAGRIDAYSVAEPWGIRGVNEGVAHILEFSKNIVPDHACCLVMVRKPVIEKQPDAVSEWVKSLQHAGWAIHTDPDRAGLLQKPYMKHIPDEIALVVKDDMISYSNLTPDLMNLSAIHDLALECNVLAEKCNLDEFIDSRFA